MADLMAGTGAAMISFVDYTGEKGLVNPGTAKAIKVSVREVLEQAEGQGWEVREVRGLDVEDVLQRFDTKTAGKYTFKSRQAYHGRFRRALTMYNGFLMDPGGWRPSKQPRSPSSPLRRASKERVEENSASPPPPPVDEAPDMMTYPFPLRRDGNVVFARLILPHDLTPKEAARIAEHIKTLAVDVPEPPKIEPELPGPEPKPKPEAPSQ